MKPGAAGGLLLDVVLGLGLVLAAVGLVEHARSARLELGRTRLVRIDDTTREVLADLDDRVFLTYYVTSAEEMPSHLRRLERDVTDLLESLARASEGKLEYEVVDPTGDDDLERFAARRRVAPVRERHVTRDSYTEQEIWSTLSITYGPRAPALIEGLGNEHLPRLQALIAEHLRRMAEPRRPVFALQAPEGFSLLEAALAERGEVLRIEAGEPLPGQADVVLWMEPGEVTPARLDELDRLLDAGRSVIVAGSLHAPRLAGDEGAERLVLEPSGYDAGALLGHFGLRPVGGLLMDGRNRPLPLGPDREVPAPFRITCIATNQDFHTLTMEPNGTFLFVTPTPLAPDSELLGERGWTAEVLASSSDLCWSQEVPADGLPLTSMTPDQGVPVAKQPLIVRLRPADRWRGDVVALASADPLRDGLLDAGGVAHPRLLKVLLDTLAAPDRLVMARAGIDRPDPLPELDAGARLLWRSVTILLAPTLLLVAALRRRGPGRGKGGRAGRPSLVRPVLGSALAVGALALVLPLLGGGWRLDTTSEGLNTLHPETARLAAAATGPGALRAELVLSPRASLPHRLRPQLDRLEGLLDDLALAGADLRIERITPEDLSADEQEQLRAGGLAPVKATSRDEEVTTVRTVWSSLRLSAGDRSEVLPFPDEAAFENLEFRLAFALWRLQTGRDPLVAFASDVPRLSAAEAHQFYQTQGLIAPQGKDVYSGIRDVVAGADFRVTHVSPRDPELPEDTDTLVWLQPRRSISAMLAATVDHLYRGGEVLLAAQHFNIQSRQYRGTDFEFVYWPQPQTPDLDAYYLPDLGIELVREVLFDEVNTPLDIESQITRAARRDFTSMRSALPFLIRAVGANFSSASTITRQLGDQAFPWAAFLRWDEERLGALGLRATVLATTSDHAWSYDWSGGWLPDEVLSGPPVGEDGEPRWLGRVPLMALFEGRFPWPSQAFARTPMATSAGGEEGPPPFPLPEPVEAGAEGRLLLMGCSELFKDGRLAELRGDGFRSDHLMLNAVAALALPEDLAEVLSRRPVARGFDRLAPEESLRWRGVVVLGGPAALLLLALVWAWLRAVGRPRPVVSSGARP